MVDGIGRSELARATIEAALQSQAEQARKIEAQVAPELAQSSAASAAQAPQFASTLAGTVEQVQRSVHAVDELPLGMVTGQVADFHEVVARLKQSELTFKFALEVRNKLIEAYRETMRMSV